MTENIESKRSTPEPLGKWKTPNDSEEVERQTSAMWVRVSFPTKLGSVLQTCVTSRRGCTKRGAPWFCLSVNPQLTYCVLNEQHSDMHIFTFNRELQGYLWLGGSDKARKPWNVSLKYLRSVNSRNIRFFLLCPGRSNQWQTQLSYL